MIDVHCHALPGLDDGPSSLEEAVELARAQVAAGVTKVVATPHWSWDYAPGVEEVAAAVAELRGSLEAESIPLAIETGSEIVISIAADATNEQLAAASLGGAGWLLLEAPLTMHAPGFHEMVQVIQSRGFRILLAHPERCPEIHRSPKILSDLVGIGVRVQVTASSLTGAFGRQVQELSRTMVAEGLVHNVASDAHDSIHRPPGMRGAVESAGLGGALDWWTQEFPTAILDGRPPPAMPAALRSLFAEGSWRQTGVRTSGPRRWFGARRATS